MEQILRPGIIPADLTLLHAVAIAIVFGSWLAYGPLLATFWKGTLNNQLDSVRLHWMTLSVSRENRTFDALLLGHITHSVAFFGSATLILLAALFGTLVSVAEVHASARALPFIAETSQALFATNLGMITLLLLVSFFSFTYALRQLIYTVALVGSLPDGEGRIEGQAVMVEAAATVLTEAVRSFNSGIRGYYYTVAAMFLFVDPAAAIMATLAVMIMLFYRQTSTRTSAAIGRYVSTLERSSAPIDRK